MKRVCIGVHIQTEPQRLRETLFSISRNTSCAYELIILTDGADAETTQALQEISVRQSSTIEPRGVAACFNRLVSDNDAEVFVLLESGAIVGADWLERLCQALYADARNGLAGPSTNNCWNEQGVFSKHGGASEEITNTAAEAAQMFGDMARTLAPLYSLSDFCYLAKREVIAAVGAADESYGLGPCWEMDYNIRAARAGWRGIWVGGAYVYRAPFTTRRLKTEALKFELSKRLYQERFCGARLRGEKTSYRSHCSGDACPNFAPASLITIHRNLSSVQVETASLIRVNETNEPLVTCIMPTYNRRQYIPQALRCFQKQTYTNKELLIVDDSEQAIDDCIPTDERVRYLRLEKKLTIGAKRNIACENARGEFIVHFDDDDWYPTHRISEQIQALQQSGADVCGSSRIYFQEASTNKAWEYRYENNSSWVAGSTLVYRKSFWQRHRFQDIQVGEDARFVWNETKASLKDLANPSLCVASVHPHNTSKKNTAGSFWHPIEIATVRALLGDEINFYRALSEEKVPLVSCIMPTYNRRAFVPQSLKHFYAQDYPNKELIIVDDGEDSVAELVTGLPEILYLRLNKRHSIGAKRNIACRSARGEIIALWDDDDWYSSDRLRYQVAPILADEADMTGLKETIFADLATGHFWRIGERLHERMFWGNVPGGTLVYRRTLLSKGLVYPEINLAEDAWFLQHAVRKGFRLLQLPNPEVFVYVRHKKNTWADWKPGEFLDHTDWQRIEPPKLFITTHQ